MLPFMMHYRLDRASIPVLMYHQIHDNGAAPTTPYATSAAAFVSHLHFLRDAGFHTLSMHELLSGSIQPQSAVITFDDGYLDNYTLAFPALRRVLLKATFFVIVSRIGQPGYMTWDHLREMQAHGMEIQSHTLTHPHLETLPAAAIRIELRESRAILENELKTSVDFISFPNGSYDETVIQTAAEAGYAGSCTSDFGYFSLATIPHCIPRIAVRSSHGLSDFRKIVSKDKVYLAKLGFASRIRRTTAQAIGVQNYQRIYNKFYRKGRAQHR
jgi:peptidoglycan/xylan/chitin deacetylase (PgdA/CDA1 family)